MCGIKEFESEFANKCEGNFFFLKGGAEKTSVLYMSIRMTESGLGHRPGILAFGM